MSEKFSVPVIGGLKKIYATERLEFSIKLCDVEEAVCSNPSACVIAQAIWRTQVYSSVEQVHVGTNITKIVFGDKVVIYGTPAKLATAIKVFDKTGVWKLEAGLYYLNVCPKKNKTRPQPPAKKKGTGHTKGGGGFVPHAIVTKERAARTRKVVNVNSLVNQ